MVGLRALGDRHLSLQETISSLPRLRLRYLRVHGVDAGMSADRGIIVVVED